MRAPTEFVRTRCVKFGFRGLIEWLVCFQKRTVGDACPYNDYSNFLLNNSRKLSKMATNML